MVNIILKTAETIIYDDDGYRYRVFIEGETGAQIVYEEFDSVGARYVQKDRIGLPFIETVDAIIGALEHVKDILKGGPRN